MKQFSKFSINLPIITVFRNYTWNNYLIDLGIHTSMHEPSPAFVVHMIFVLHNESNHSRIKYDFHFGISKILLSWGSNTHRGNLR